MAAAERSVAAGTADPATAARVAALAGARTHEQRHRWIGSSSGGAA